MEEVLHADGEGFVVPVNGGPVGGLAAAAGLRTPARDRCDDLVAEREHAGDGAGRVGRYVIAARPAGLRYEALAAELAQVVRALLGRVAGGPPWPSWR
jgi:hypothetical protein